MNSSTYAILNQLNFWCECCIIGKKCICFFWNRQFSKQSAASVGNLPSKDPGGHLLERVTEGGRRFLVPIILKLLSILSRIYEMFYPLKIPFSNFCPF